VSHSHGVDRIFGIPACTPIIYSMRCTNAVRRSPSSGRADEQGAAYMALGYAKSTGKIGVYTCVPGPGLLNTAAALCSAYSANAPVLCLTSEIPGARYPVAATASCTSYRTSSRCLRGLDQVG